MLIAAIGKKILGQPKSRHLLYLKKMWVGRRMYVLKAIILKHLLNLHYGLE